jgi:hypothetical protein
MLYTLALEITHGTTAATKVEELLKLTDGVITRVEVEFPAGCAGLAHSYARRGLHQVFPTNPDGDLCSDNHTISWNEYEDMAVDPRNLVIGGWNTDDTYDHTITWRVELTDREVAERLKVQQSMITRILQMLGIR